MVPSTLFILKLPILLPVLSTASHSGLERLGAGKRRIRESCRVSRNGNLGSEMGGELKPGKQATGAALGNRTDSLSAVVFGLVGTVLTVGSPEEFNRLLESGLLPRLCFA